MGRDQFILSVLEGARTDPPEGASAVFADQVRADQAYLSDKVEIGTYYAVHLGLSNVGKAEDFMELYAGPQSDIDSIRSEIDAYHDLVLDGGRSGLILQIVGVQESDSLF